VTFQVVGCSWSKKIKVLGAAAQLHVNATSTRIRRFCAASDGENRSMLGFVALEIAQNQRLGA
jgi:hypothetical protein